MLSLSNKSLTFLLLGTMSCNKYATDISVDKRLNNAAILFHKGHKNTDHKGTKRSNLSAKFKSVSASPQFLIKLERFFSYYTSVFQTSVESLYFITHS